MNHLYTQWFQEAFVWMGSNVFMNLLLCFNYLTNKFDTSLVAVRVRTECLPEFIFDQGQDVCDSDLEYHEWSGLLWFVFWNPDSYQQYNMHHGMGVQGCVCLIEKQPDSPEVIPSPVSSCMMEMTSCDPSRPRWPFWPTKQQCCFPKIYGARKVVNAVMKPVSVVETFRDLQVFILQKATCWRFFQAFVAAKMCVSIILITQSVSMPA